MGQVFQGRADNQSKQLRIMQAAVVPLEEIESEADFVLYSGNDGLVSEHFTEGEARMAYYKQAAGKALGQQLPIIYERHETVWIPLN
jgi:hypothetical protein